MSREEWTERSRFIPTMQQKILVGKESRRIMHWDNRKWRGGAIKRIKVMRLVVP
jgi:hypothetical protein